MGSVKSAQMVTDKFITEHHLPKGDITGTVTRKYANPPVQEVCAEIRFERPENWDLTLPGLIYQALGGEEKFPHKEQERALAKSSLTLGPSSLRQTADLVDRVKLFTDDRTTVIQLSSDLLSVHKLAPYDTWEAFAPVIGESLSEYVRYAQPKALAGLKLYYVDRIELPCGIDGIGQYLNLAPYAGPELMESEQFDTFISGICSRHEGGRDALRMELLTVAPSESSKLHLQLLSLYFLVNIKSVPLETPEIMTWLKTAHDNVSRAFESCITDNTRALFGEVMT
ncbi:MAG: TIGR04255 family protein [Candidatus Coatesbacteria bacterium]|nr:TIGR04255 family protein [Candidatus Coatesbacteria bacterium]